MIFDLTGAIGPKGLSLLSTGHQATAMLLPRRDAAGTLAAQPGAMIARPSGVWWMMQAPAASGSSSPVQALRLFPRTALFRQLDQPGQALSMVLLEQDDRADRVALRVSLAQLAQPMSPRSTNAGQPTR
jgi:hypothetical protein